MCTPPARRSPYSQQKAALNSKVSQTLVFGPAPKFFLHRTSTSTSVASFGCAEAMKARRKQKKITCRKGNVFPGFYFLLSSGSFLHCYCAAIFSILPADETMKGLEIVLICHCGWIWSEFTVTRVGNDAGDSCLWYFWHDLVISMLSRGRHININGHSVEGRRWARLLGRHIGPWWICQQIRLKQRGVLMTSCTGCGLSEIFLNK